MKRMWTGAIAALAVLVSSCGNNNTTAGNNDSTSTSGTDTANKTYTLEPVFMDSTYQFTGLAKEEGGRLLINYPMWSPIYKYAVVTAEGMSGKTPYPDSATNMWKSGQPGTSKWVCVQSVYVDDAGGVWVLDPAAPMLKKIQGNGAKLVKMKKDGTGPEQIYPLGGPLSDTSYANDVRVDTKNNFAYITDSKTGGIIIVNLTSGKVREVLKGHSSTVSDPAYKFVIDGRELMKQGKPAKFNSDGIALTPDRDWLYYKPLTDDKLYRIKTEYLRDTSLVDSAFNSKVEDLGHFNTTDGMIFDQDGNLYMGDLQEYAIVKLDKDLKKTVLVKDPKLIWPDSYSIADGYLYLTCSQINMQPDYNNGVNKRTTPYMVYRIKL
jgi:sugar lactone lactonase YvrE